MTASDSAATSGERATGTRWRLRLPGLRLYEAITVGHVALLLLAIRYGARLSFNALQTLLELRSLLLLGLGSLLLALGLKASLVAVRGGRARAARLLLLWIRPASLADTFRLLLVLGLVSYGYSWLKVFLPLLNPALHDDLFYRMDNAIHMGVNPNRFALALLPFGAVWRLVDVQYGAFFYTVMFGFGWFGSSVCLADRRRFAAGFTILWLAGSWIYLAAPCLGPVYAFRDEYEAVRRAAPGQAHTQDLLIRQYTAVRAYSRSREGNLSLNPVFGVAAMPSLHVAGQLFLALVARRRCRALCCAYTLLALLTFYGSLVTGWHYAVDGYAGALLALGVFAFSHPGGPARP